MEHYLVIDDDGSVYKVKPGADSLADLQALVIGRIELIRVPQNLFKSVDAWVNEEGLIAGDFVYNFLGSYICGTDLVGPVVFTSCDDEGNTTPVIDGFSRNITQECEVFGNGELLTVETCVAAMAAMRERSAASV
ncbi:MAG: hypothetical protein CMD74_00770 [Gammaproteobacteria bacterium]|nr:hypothetical protein [Gammaproteobacteria bacterium]|tara:strand:+ start:107 stop:511 length:405 start_codon:yes stop_codon:yes gene_type:complete